MDMPDLKKIENKIKLAREKRNDLINKEKNFFIISVGLDEEIITYTYRIDKNYKRDLIFLGFSSILGHVVSKPGLDKEDRRWILGEFARMVLNKQDEHRSFKNKFCLCLFYIENGGSSCTATRSDNFLLNDYVFLLAYVFDLISEKFDSDEKKEKFFSDVMGVAMEYLETGEVEGEVYVPYKW